MVEPILVCSSRRQLPGQKHLEAEEGQDEAIGTQIGEQEALGVVEADEAVETMTTMNGPSQDVMTAKETDQVLMTEIEVDGVEGVAWPEGVGGTTMMMRTDEADSARCTSSR